MKFFSALCFLLEIFLITGKGPTLYLYFRRKFSWDESGFGSYIGIFGILGLLAQYVVIPFMSSRLHDMTICLIAIAGVILQQLIICYSTADMIFMVYIAGVPAILSVCITTVCRSLISKCVQPWEIGTVFSVIGALQVNSPFQYIHYFLMPSGNDASNCKSTVWFSLQENIGNILWSLHSTECVPLLGDNDNG